MRTFKFAVIIFSFLFTTMAFAQQSYTVNGNTYILKTEVEGKITLLWNVVDGEYRYFAKKNNDIVELKNTRKDGKYQEEYKQTLTRLTADHPVDASRTNLTLTGLRSFFNAYNKLADVNYVELKAGTALENRLGIFGGWSNNNATTNPQNIFAPLLGAEFEVTDNMVLRRHAIVLQFRHSFKVKDYDLTFSQFALNYRYKFIHNDTFSVYAQAKMVTLTFAKLDENNVEGLEELSRTSVNTPIGLGVGIDYKLGNGFLTFALNDLVAPGLDTNGEFSVDVVLGYKFRL